MLIIFLITKLFKKELGAPAKIEFTICNVVTYCELKTHLTDYLLVKKAVIICIFGTHFTVF